MKLDPRRIRGRASPYLRPLRIVPTSLPSAIRAQFVVGPGGLEGSRDIFVHIWAQHKGTTSSKKKKKAKLQRVVRGMKRQQHQSSKNEVAHSYPPLIHLKDALAIAVGLNVVCEMCLRMPLFFTDGASLQVAPLESNNTVCLSANIQFGAGGKELLSLPSNLLLAPTLLLFFVTIVKYAKRSYSLYIASTDGFRSSVVISSKQSQLNQISSNRRTIVTCLNKTKNGELDPLKRSFNRTLFCKPFFVDIYSTCGCIQGNRRHVEGDDCQGSFGLDKHGTQLCL
ncbi:hypothetical protein HPP92_027684 [Vanilla planifolia]|uniref:DUF4220 domain-containing protein n=1 Tax=Vanilla planifolia TaxID=51239 RepID=A0A835U4T1_VANPL|nr:hypothetical protein HPP92_027684 [Vanilla planifolia]